MGGLPGLCGIRIFRVPSERGGSGKRWGTKDGIRYHGDSDPVYGIEWLYKTGEQGGALVTWRVLTVPYYGLFMLSLALPVMRGLMFMRRRRRGGGGRGVVLYAGMICGLRLSGVRSVGRW